MELKDKVAVVTGAAQGLERLWLTGLRKKAATLTVSGY